MKTSFNTSCTDLNPSGIANGPIRQRQKWVELVSLLVALGGTAALAFSALNEQANGVDPVSADASACFAVVNAGVLLENAQEVPSTAILSAALANVSKTAPVAVAVVRRSSSAIGVEFSPDVAQANPDLVRAYASIDRNRLTHPSCPYSDAARENLSKMVAMTYPTARP